MSELESWKAALHAVASEIGVQRDTFLSGLSDLDGAFGMFQTVFGTSNDQRVMESVALSFQEAKRLGQDYANYLGYMIQEINQMADNK